MLATQGSLERRLTSIVDDIHTGRRKPHILSFSFREDAVQTLAIEFFKDSAFEKVYEAVSFKDILPALLANSSTVRRAKKQGESDCCICLHQYRCREHVRRLPCAHEFHAKCFEPWCRHSKSITCPICRESFEMQAVVPLVMPFDEDDMEFNSRRCVCSVELRRLDPREKLRPYQADLEKFISDMLRPASAPDQQR